MKFVSSKCGDGECVVVTAMTESDWPQVHTEIETVYTPNKNMIMISVNDTSFATK